MRPNFYQRRATPNFGKLPAILWRLVCYCLYALIAYAVWGFAKRTWDCRSAGKMAGVAATESGLHGPDAAKEILREAFSLCPENPKAARVMAGLLDAEGSAQAVAYHLIVLESGEATDADRRAMIDSALRHGEEPGALEKAVEVAGELGDPALPHLVKARIHARHGEAWESEQELRRAVATRPEPDTWIALARVLMANAGSNDAAGGEALDLLRRVAQSDRGSGGLEAIEVAVDGGLLNQEALGEWLDMHRSHPAADTVSRLRADAIALQKNPAMRGQVLERLVMRSRELPVEDKISVARWLVERGEAARVGGFWPVEEALSGGGEAFLVWIEAASASGAWDTVDEALGRAANPLKESQSLAILSNAANASGDAERSAVLGRAAVAACGANPESRIEVVRLFLKGGNFPPAIEHLSGLVSDPVMLAMVEEELVPLVGGGHGASEALAFYEEMLKLPGARTGDLLSDRADRLRLFLDGEVSEAGLQERLKQQPENPSPRLTLALSHLLQGRASRAGYEVGLLDSEIEPGKLNPSDRVAMAVLVAAGGNPSEALALAAEVGREDVTVEEFALIEKHVRGTPD